jgi:hypothetical protein
MDRTAIATGASVCSEQALLDPSGVSVVGVEVTGSAAGRFPLDA